MSSTCSASSVVRTLTAAAAGDDDEVMVVVCRCRSALSVIIVLTVLSLYYNVHCQLVQFLSHAHWSSLSSH